MPIELSQDTSIDIMSKNATWQYFIYYLGKIIIAFGYYQTISAFRKHKSI